MAKKLNSKRQAGAKADYEIKPIVTTSADIAANQLLAAGVILFDGEKVVIQSAKYIEDGWYIEIIHNEITLWEIPYGGGEPIRVSGFLTVAGAIHATGRLT